MSARAKKAVAPRKKANGYKMPAPIPPGEVIHDPVCKKKWQIGPSIGVGGFGEIYSACDHEGSPKKGASGYPYVIKIEPHENGPLFVEKHFYIRNCNKDDITKFMKSRKLSSLGMPSYYGNGAHDFKGDKYRYLVLERYGKDLWNLFKECKRSFPPATVFQIGLQMLDTLEYIHSRGYVHADLKGANILLGLKKGTENQAYLVDFGLAARVKEKEFKPDPKCAHNGTIEYTSRDAHLGVATMRGDLEILAYNMLQWIVGELPWENNLKQPKTVQDAKEAFMKNVKSNLAKYNVPDALIKFFEYINTLKPKDVPDYTKCRNIFESYLKSEGKTRNSKLEFTPAKTSKTTKKTAQRVDTDSASEEDDEPIKSPKKAVKITKKKTPKENGDAPKVVKRGRAAKVKETSTDSDNCENETPNSDSPILGRGNKRKSPVVSTLAMKKTKLTPKSTPPVKKNHANMATQTSVERKRKSPRQVSFDSPICEIIGDAKPIDSSGDIFDDSFTIEGKKKPKKRLISAEEITVKRVVKKKVTAVKPKAKSWKAAPAIVNGRSPPN